MPEFIPLSLIPEGAFEARYKLESVHLSLSEGLLEIGRNAFRYCVKLKNIRIPSTVQTIGRQAFCNTKLHYVHSLRWRTKLLNFRVPLLITTVPDGMFSEL